MKTMSQVMIGAVTAVLCASTVGCGNEEDAVETVGSALTYGNCAAFTDNQVCVCTDPNGLGVCKILDTGTRFYTNISTMTFPTNLTALNDKITSVRTGANVSAYMCQDIAWNGSCVRVAPGQIIGVLGSPMNDTITSIRLDPSSFNCLAPGPQQVSIFIDPNFSGDCVVLEVGQYRWFNGNPTSGYSGGGFGLKNDSISSVINGSAVRSIWYRDNNLTPTPGVDTPPSAIFPTMGNGQYNDWISSLAVSF